MANPHRVGHFIGVWIYFNIGAHHDDVVEFPLNPFVIHSCGVSHFCHERHLVGRDGCGIDSQFLFQFSHGGPLNTHGVAFVQLFWAVQWVGTTGIGPHIGEGYLVR